MEKSLFSSIMGRIWSHFCHDDTDRELTIHVTTGDRRRAGTDANIWIKLHDEKEQSTDTIKLSNTFKNDHERGATCTFSRCSGNGFGKPCKLEIWRDSFGLGDNWFLERIDVEDKTHGSVHVFPVQRWIRSHQHYIFREYDCCLPQEDEHHGQRRTELKCCMKTYQYAVHIEGGPSQITKLPGDEEFTGVYERDFAKTKARLLLETKVIRWTTDKWESISDLKKVYKLSLEVPACLEYWNEDRWFGLQRVQGVNPVLIKLCTAIPKNFTVTSEMVEPFLDGMKLHEALRAKRIFIVDLAILEGISCKDGRTLCAPLALFFLNNQKQLMPIAIQLFQKAGPKNPVFLPSDPSHTWLMAKIYYNNADATYHQSCTHLGFTHLLMEGVVICTHRNISPSHPLYKLLAPHFLFLIAINSRGLQKLTAPGGWIDKTMTVGRDGMFELIKKGISQFQMNVHAIVPNEIKSREVDSNVLPHYPYRDDAMQIYLTIRKYVSKIVHHFYDTDDKITTDYELQRWRAELIKDRKLGGCGFLTPLTENDILNSIPNKETTLDVMVITRLLSRKATQSLGYFESQFMYHPVCVRAADEFREELAEISKHIKLRNQASDPPYGWLDPEFIPNAISI